MPYPSHKAFKQVIVIRRIVVIDTADSDEQNEYTNVDHLTMCEAFRARIILWSLNRNDVATDWLN